MSNGSPCTWPVEMSCLPSDPDPEYTRESVATAVGILWALTGRTFGVCPVEARPCPPGGSGWSAVPLTAGPGWGPVLEHGVFRNVPTCTTATCDRTGAVVLPGPVHRLLGVTVGEDEIALSSFVMDGDRLYRRGGLPWPGQDLSAAPGDDGYFAVRYERGVPPPAGAGRMAGRLAAEFYELCRGRKCKLPATTRTVTREGVTVTMVDAQDIYEQRATGLPEVDMWVRAHNPYRLDQPSSVWSPDMGVW